MPEALWLTRESFKSVDGDRFAGWKEVYLIFDSDIVNYFLKITEGRDRMPNCVICVVSRALIGSGRVVVAWSRKCCLGPSEIASFVSQVLFKEGGRKVTPRFHISANIGFIG